VCVCVKAVEMAELKSEDLQARGSRSVCKKLEIMSYRMALSQQGWRVVGGNLECTPTYFQDTGDVVEATIVSICTRCIVIMDAEN
jgi:hypothetical protein